VAGLEQPISASPATSTCRRPPHTEDASVPNERSRARISPVPRTHAGPRPPRSIEGLATLLRPSSAESNCLLRWCDYLALEDSGDFRVRTTSPKHANLCDQGSTLARKTQGIPVEREHQLAASRPPRCRGAYRFRSYRVIRSDDVGSGCKR